MQYINTNKMESSESDNDIESKNKSIVEKKNEKEKM